MAEIEWLFNHTCNKIEKLIQKNYLDSKLNALFGVLPITHDKIILALVQQCIKYDLPFSKALHYPIGTSAKQLRHAVLAFILNSGVFVFSIIKYCIISFFYQLIFGKSSQFIYDKNDLRFVFINSAGGVDRLSAIIQENFHKNKYIMLYLFTSFPRKIFERLKIRPTIKFVSPQLPSMKAVYACLAFLFRCGQDFTTRLFRSFDEYQFILKLQVVTAINKYIYALLIYHPWAEGNAFKMAKAYPNAVFIFDLDEAGKELLLADSLNQLEKKTLLVQHGVLTDAKRYIPTCSYMACNSERDRQSLISEGVSSKRLYVTGQPLQTIEDSILFHKNGKPSYPILILAGAGPIWLQRLYVKMLKRSQYLERYPHAFMRIHPAMNAKKKKIWIFNKDLTPTDPKEPLGECISKCTLVITFSIDALIVAVRQKHPTIVCIPESYFVPSWHNFLEGIPLVRVAKTSLMLDAILEDEKFWNCQQNDLSESQLRYVDYAFGELNTKASLKKLMHQLSTGQNLIN